VKNDAIMRSLRETFPSVRTSDELGVPSQAREAMAFAILGATTLDRVPGNIISVTGASHPVVLGCVTPRP
jgi:anhydro-N-acetylmuramic acid kinase